MCKELICSRVRWLQARGIMYMHLRTYANLLSKPIRLSCLVPIVSLNHVASLHHRSVRPYVGRDWGPTGNRVARRAVRRHQRR